MHTYPVTVNCGENIDLLLFQSCQMPSGGTTSSGVWDDITNMISLTSQNYIAHNNTTLHREIFDPATCTLCIDEIVITVIPLPVFIVDLCVPPEMCTPYDILSSGSNCGPIMPGTQFHHRDPNGIWTNTSNSYFMFCNPFDIGMHEITYTNQNGCECSVTFNITPGPCFILSDAPGGNNGGGETTGEQNNLSSPAVGVQSKIDISPNPSNGIYNMIYRYKSNSGKNPNYNVTVYNSIGQIIYSKNGIEMNYREVIDLTNFASGMYTVKINTNGKNEYIKLVKE